MPTGIFIPCDDRQAVILREFNSLEDYQTAVGGYVEAIYTRENDVTFFANEEAKLIGLALNRRATVLWHLQLYPVSPRDILSGDVVLIGPSDADGETLDVSSDFQRLLFTPSTYAVEMRAQGSDEWQREPQAFSDFFVAGAWGLAVAAEERAAGVRVVPNL